MVKMTEDSSEDWFLQREDRSNFQYAGMYLIIVTSIFFLFIFIDAILWAFDWHGLSQEWNLEFIWNALMNLLIFVAGLVIFYLLHTRRNFPLIMTFMALALGVSVINLFNSVLWPTLTFITFVCTLSALVLAVKGEREFPTPRLQQRILEAHIDRHPILRERHKKKSKAPAYRPGVRELDDDEYEEVEGVDCPNCGEFVADDDDYCPGCNADVDNMLKIEKVQVAYQSGQITAQQYQQAMQNLQRRR